MVKRKDGFRVGTGTENDLTLVHVLLPWPWGGCQLPIPSKKPDEVWTNVKTHIRHLNSGLQFRRATRAGDASADVFTWEVASLRTGSWLLQNRNTNHGDLNQMDIAVAAVIALLYPLTSPCVLPGFCEHLPPTAWALASPSEDCLWALKETLL